jgi:hypothetical protein
MLQDEVLSLEEILAEGSPLGSSEGPSALTAQVDVHVVNGKRAGHEAHPASGLRSDGKTSGLARYRFYSTLFSDKFSS